MQNGNASLSPTTDGSNGSLSPNSKSPVHENSLATSAPPPPAPPPPPPPPPCPPPLPLLMTNGSSPKPSPPAPIPPPPAGMMQAPDGAMTIKRKVNRTFHFYNLFIRSYFLNCSFFMFLDTNEIQTANAKLDSLKT